MTNESRYDVEKLKWDEKSAQVLERRANWKADTDYEKVFTENLTLKPVYDYFSDLDKNASIVLDYGCGEGWSAMLLSSVAKEVTAIDISQGRIDVVNKFIEENNELANIKALAINGERLPFDDDSFDFVFGNAIIHHLVFDDCLQEISRVLKPGGRAAFCEPFAENPLINLYRYVHHHFFEDHVGTDKPLVYADIEIFKKYFSKVEFIESSFLRDRYPFMRPIERLMLKIPFLRRYVCYICILLEK